jgi:hypothetical protein
MFDDLLITVEFVQEFVKILGSQPIRTRSVYDIVKTVRDKERIKFAFSDSDMILLRQDYVFCCVYAFVRDNQDLFLKDQ